MKISRKFAAKGYANISRKSIKYKYEKLQAADRLRELEAEVAMENDEESGDDTEMEVKVKKPPIKKKYCTWDEEMEVTMLNHITKLRSDHPAMSENAMFRTVTRNMQREGYASLTDHIVLYHYRKLKLDDEKFRRLMEQSRGFDEIPSDKWSKMAEAAMLHCYNKIRERDSNLKPMEIYSKVQRQLETSGHGNFSQISIRNQFLSASNCGDESEDSEHHNVDTPKRNYLYWTDEMKAALIRYRAQLKEQPGMSELWENVAQKMREDGYGFFTADNVRYKYFNLRRKESSAVVEGLENDEL